MIDALVAALCEVDLVVVVAAVFADVVLAVVVAAVVAVFPVVVLAVVVAVVVAIVVVHNLVVVVVAVVFLEPPSGISAAASKSFLGIFVKAVPWRKSSSMPV